MTVEGIWTGEFHGPYGWEESGVYVLEHGQILGGNNRHYSNGTYRVSGNTYTADIDVHYYGPPRAVFGEKRSLFKIHVTGEIKDEMIEATVERPDRPGFSLEYHMTRRMDLPHATSEG